MSSKPIVISVEKVGKCYELYKNPSDRLKQIFSVRKKYYDEFWALKDINLEIRKGETVGIIGVNGSGKSTLLQTICGTLTPTMGSVQVKGKVAALLELGAGFNPDFTGIENVYLSCALYGLTEKEIDNRLESILNFADIGDFANHPVKTYSSGMFVRLAFAVIAHVDADILIIDEALAVGDAIFTQKCMAFIRDFKRNNTLLFVSHDTSSVMNLCDKAIWLENGRLKISGKSKDVCEKYIDYIFSKRFDFGSETQEVKSKQKSRVGDFEYVDYRQNQILNSNLRNELEIFRFNENSNAYVGSSQAQIINVSLADNDGNAYSWFLGGEECTLTIRAEALESFDLPIIGFFVKDRLGQNLFGDNTYFSSRNDNVTVKEGEHIIAKFQFTMPWLAAGDYVIQVAIAAGTQHEHRQIHWVHDALVIKSHHDPVTTGLIGIPMKKIELVIEDA